NPRPVTSRLHNECETTADTSDCDRKVRNLPGESFSMSHGQMATEDADLRLMQRVAANDAAAMSTLYDRFGSLVYRLAYQVMRRRADAEDAVQEVFVRLWRTAGRYDPKRAALVTWVMLISRRHLVDRLRRARARVRAGTLDEKQGQTPAPESVQP